MIRSLFLASLFGLVACSAVTQSEEGDEDVPEAVATLFVRGGAGDVRVTGDPTATGARLRWRMSWSDTRPTLTHGIVAGEWAIETDCPMQLACFVDLDLTVPEGAGALVDVGSGDVTVRGLAGDVDVDAGSGDVWLDGLAGAAEVDLGSGDLSGDALLGPIRAVVGSGDVDLTLATPADVDLSVGSGDVGLTVPGGSYALAIETSSGEVSITGVEDDAASAISLRVETGSGDVTIAAR